MSQRSHLAQSPGTTRRAPKQLSSLGPWTGGLQAWCSRLHLGVWSLRTMLPGQLEGPAPPPAQAGRRADTVLPQFAQQGSRMVRTAPGSWSPSRAPPEPSHPCWREGWAQWARRGAGGLPPLSILSPPAVSTAGRGLTGCHGCHLPWRQAKAVTASAIAMETMSQGHAQQSRACQELSGPLACQRERQHLPRGISSGLINGVEWG